MSRYTGPSCKICRRNREKLFLKGERCFTAKCAIEKRNVPPGPQSGVLRKLSEYGRRLREKQKLRFLYGVTEAQMQIAFKKALAQKGVTGSNLLTLFERRIDNVLYRAGFSLSRKDGRQFVLHGHVSVNNAKSNIPSRLLKVGDEISLVPGVVPSFKLKKERIGERNHPTWFSFDEEKGLIKILTFPKREEVDIPVDVQLIVEYYSR